MSSVRTGGAMRRVTLRNLMSHKLRLALTAIAVVLGVSFVAGTLIFTDTMSKSFDDLFSKFGKGVAVEIRAKKVVDGFGASAPTPPIPASVLSTVGKVDGVTNVRGDVSGYTGVIGKNGKVIVNQGAPQIGANWVPGGYYTIKSGLAPAGPDEVAIDEQTVKTAGLTVGDTARIVLSGPVQTMRLVGVIDTGNLQGATFTAFESTTAQRLLLRPGYFSTIAMGTTGPSETVLRDRVAQVLPAGLEAVTGTKVRDEAKSQLATIMNFFRIFLLTFAFISIFVGAFIIFNTFSMLVAQRTRELALLRAIGASRKQVTRAVIGEALVVGFLGSTVGIALGMGLAALLQTIFSNGAPTSPLVLTATPFIWSYTVGILVTVVSAYMPARRAAKIPPVAAMRDDVALPQRSLRIRVGIGSVLTGGGAILMALGIGGVSDQPLALLGAGAAGVFLGVAMLAPVISRPVVRFLGGAYPKVFGTPGRLAQQNAMRNPRRTAATAAALMIGLALVTTINVMSSTMKASVGKAVDKGFGADYLISSTSREGLAKEITQVVQNTPGVKQTTPMYQGFAKIDGKREYYRAADTSALLTAAKLRITSGSIEVGNDGMLVDEDTAKSHRWKVGSVARTQFPDGMFQPVRVAGVYAPNQFLGPHLLAVPLYQAHTDSSRQLVAALAVIAQKADAATRNAVERSLKDYPDIQVQDQSDVKKRFQGQVDQLAMLLTMLLAMSLIIAAVGVVNTLALSVIERTREIGLLRAVGTSRRQIRRMIRLESIVIAVFGAALGITIGLAFGIAIQRGLRDQGLDVLDVPVGTLVLYVVLAGIIGIVAALWPAWRAGRMDILAAIGSQ